MSLQFKNLTDGAVVTPQDVADDLDGIYNRKINELKLSCTITIYNGFTSSVTDVNGMSYEFGYNALDQGNFDKQVGDINFLHDRLSDGKLTQTEFDANFPIRWKSKNLGVISLTEDEFFRITRDAKNHLLNNQQKYWNLESQVITAYNNGDQVGIDAVVW